MNIKNKILLVGGGTGGHIFPLIAVAEDLEIAKIPFIFIGEKDGREQAVVAESNWPFFPIQAGKWRRYNTLPAFVQNTYDLLKFIVGFFQAIKIIRTNNVSTVFSKGGYVALPVILAAKLLGKKIVIHESDTVMGLTNKISARFADKVLTAFKTDIFPNTDSRFEQVGIPIRKVLRAASKLKPPQKSKPLILVMAGIQGSRKINQLVKDVLPELLPMADIIHVTGESDYLTYKNLAENFDVKQKSSYKVYSILKRELSYYYQLSDLIICRSGATTLAESALFRKALYLIPLSNSAGNHQAINAAQLQSSGAAITAGEETLTSERFIQEIRKIMLDKPLQNMLGERLKAYFNQENTNQRIVEILTKDNDDKS